MRGGPGQRPDDQVRRLQGEAADLIRLLRRWTDTSWRLPAVRPGAGLAGSPGRPPAGTRGDEAYGSVQRLADLVAVAAGEAPRQVPREADLVLPDQLAVMVSDLALIAEPRLADRARAELAWLRAALGVR